MFVIVCRGIREDIFDSSRILFVTDHATVVYICSVIVLLYLFLSLSRSFLMSSNKN